MSIELHQNFCHDIASTNSTSFLIERTMSLNVFGCPSSSLEIHMRAQNNKSIDEKHHHSCGIWPQASYINHSCMGSARRSFIGDMLIVRATRDLELGDEVTFPYRKPELDEDMRDKLKNWGFECACSLCAESKQTKASVKKERTKLAAVLMKECSTRSRKPSVSSIERLLNRLEATYKSSPELVPRLGQWVPQMQVARVHMGNGNMHQAFRAACKVLVFLGFSLDESMDEFEVKKWGLVVDYLIESFLFIGEALAKLKATKSAEKAKGYAKTVYRIVIGEDETFEKTYKDWVF